MSWWRSATEFEAANWRALSRWALRRPVTGPGERAFGYDGPLRLVLGAFTVVSGVEVVGVDVVLSHWRPDWVVARVVALVLGVWGVTMMVGYTAQLRTTPHVVSARTLRIRHVRRLDLHLPAEDVGSVRAQHRVYPTSATLQRIEHPDGDEVAVAVQSSTNVTVRLRRPVTVRLQDGDHPVHVVSFHVDDRDGFLAAVREISAVP